jgi:DNA invertase Pin-like site-specific DNA recombinase
MKMTSAPNNIIPMNHVTGSGPGMPVVLYLRKSNKTKSKSRDETVSIKQQREELRAYCEQRGWIIVTEYVDDGKSASRNEQKRVDFARMLADVTARANFRAVVVWDLSRLTRRDSVDAGSAAGIFKKNGILVESLRDGEIDLNTEMGRHIWNLHCESNHSFATKISGGTIRGRGDSLRRGNWPHGRVPYGYRRQYWDGDKLVADLHRRDAAGKARHWQTKIVPDPEESKFAAQIIRDIANRDISIRGLAAEMTRAGAPTMNGNPWTAGHIKDVIRCPVYIGVTGIGYSHGWKKSVEGKGKGYEAHGHSQQQYNEGACEAVIDRPTWERANQKLEATHDGHRVHAGKSSPLSGILICGHCGRRMVKNTRKGVTRFTCSTAAKNPENPTCKQWTVQEADILPIFTRRLAEAVDFKLLAELAAKPPEHSTAQLAELVRQEAELAKRVAKAAKNLALCDQKVYDDVQAVLTGLKDELEKVRNTAHVIRNAGDKTEFQRIATWWAENRQKMVRVPMPDAQYEQAIESFGLPCLTEMDVRDNLKLAMQDDVFRETLKRLDARLTLHFLPKAKGKNAKKQYYALQWGRLEATLAGHSFDATGPAGASAPTVKKCASRSLAPARFNPLASATAPPTPGWTASSSRCIAK